MFRTPEKPALSSLQRQLGDLLRSKRGADVTLSCGGAELDAHSLVLAVRSGTLQRQLEWRAERAGAASGRGGAGAGAGAAAGRARLEIDGAVQPAILERMLEYLCERLRQ